MFGTKQTNCRNMRAPLLFFSLSLFNWPPSVYFYLKSLLLISRIESLDVDFFLLIASLDCLFELLNPNTFEWMA